MSAERIAEIRARLEAATPGPWKANLYLGGAYAIDRIAPNGDRLARVAVVDGMIQTPANAALIAHAPTDLAYLLDRIDKLERAVWEHGFRLGYGRGNAGPSKVPDADEVEREWERSVPHLRALADAPDPDGAA